VPFVILVRAGFIVMLMELSVPETGDLSLHDALPISPETRRAWRAPSPRHRWRSPSRAALRPRSASPGSGRACRTARPRWISAPRSEEHTSELQSRENLVCRRLLEKKKTLAQGSARCN